MGSNQRRAVELKLDFKDLAIIEWMQSFWPKMKKRIIDGKEFAWVNYTSLLADYPLMEIKSKRALYDRMQNLVEIGLLEHRGIKDKTGSFSYYRITEKIIELIDDEYSRGGMKQNSDGGRSETSDGVNETSNGVGVKLPIKDQPTNDYPSKLSYQTRLGSFSNEKKWSVEEVLVSLDPKIIRKVKESGRDLNDVLTKYVFWINKVGEPKKGFDVGFPAWFEKFFKKKLLAEDDVTIAKEITKIAAKNNEFEEIDVIRKKIKSLLFHFPQQVANKLLQANINKNTENQWEIAIDAEFLKTKSSEEIEDFEELFAQIGVLIKRDER